jgi:hypothetical protein
LCIPFCFPLFLPWFRKLAHVSFFSPNIILSFLLTATSHQRCWRLRTDAWFLSPWFLSVNLSLSGPSWTHQDGMAFAFGAALWQMVRFLRVGFIPGR